MELELVGDELPVLSMSWWCVLSVGTTLRPSLENTRSEALGSPILLYPRNP